MKVNTIKRVFIIFLVVFSISNLYAENVIDIDLSIYENFLGNFSDQHWLASSLFLGEIGFISRGDRTVKGELNLGLTAGDIVNFDLKRAYLKFRFPGIRFTIGKNAADWGEGFVFNSADLLFPETISASSLTLTEPRDLSRWYISSFIPLDPLSFLEPVILIPEVLFANLNTSNPDSVYDTQSPIYESGIGIRSYLTLGDTSLQLGYLLDGQNELQRFMLSFLAQVGIDLYIGARTGLSTRNPVADDLYDQLNISFGVSKQFEMEDNTIFSFLVESQIIPSAQWEDQSVSAVYGMDIFTELSLNFPEAIGISLRNFLNPIEGSGTFITAIQWEASTGFFLGFQNSLPFGDDTDTYTWNAENSVLFSIYARYVY